MNEPYRIFLPDSVITGLAAGSNEGPVYATSIGKGTEPGLAETTLLAADLSGRILWRRILAGPAGIPRATQAGVWLARHGPDGASLMQTGSDGSDLRSIALGHRPDEKLGAVLILPDGFCTAWTSGPPYRGARVDRHDADGASIWSTALAPEPIAHPHIMTTSAAARWQPQPRKPWIPGTFQPHPWEPLLISGDRVLASYQDPKSGLGISYFLDLATGQVIGKTKPGPIGRKAIAGPGEFVIGQQGYDDFVTVRYDRAGTQTASWPTHAAVLTDRTGRLTGIELDNRAAAEPGVRVLEPDGTLSSGPRLSGYHTALPALDRDGTAVFWRDGSLLSMTAGFSLHELCPATEGRNFSDGRVLLLGDGLVAFNLSQQIFMLHTTLGPLQDSAWPCGEGNLAGNPVLITA